MSDKPKHFAGKDAPEHLKEARLKGKIVASEVHGLEPSGFAIAYLDSALISAVFLLILWIALLSFDIGKVGLVLSVVSVSLIFFLFGRSSYYGWARLERLHRLIEEERWEIEHHRDQEKEELLEMYKAKGFSGEMLNKVVETLMADDNRLLEVMLTEELGLPLEVYEHPLKQGFFAALGALSAAVFFLFGYFLLPLFGPLIATFIIISLGSLQFARLQKNERMRSLIWNLAILMLSAGIVYFLSRMIFRIYL